MEPLGLRAEPVTWFCKEEARQELDYVSVALSLSKTFQIEHTSIRGYRFYFPQNPWVKLDRFVTAMT